MPQFFNPRLYRFLSDEFSRRPLEDVRERDEIRHRLSELHTLVQRAPRSPLRALDLHPHWLPEYLTNKIDLSPIYVHHVSEIYVRYGKSKQQIKSFKDELGDASVLPHVHISFGLSSRSFFFTIVFNLWAFLDYRNALDILREDGNSANALMQGVRELGRARYHLWGPDLNRDLSQFETPDDLRRALPLPEALVHPEDKVGMGRDWAPEDPDIDEATIVQTSINEINRLWPVFNTVALRHPR